MTSPTPRRLGVPIAAGVTVLAVLAAIIGWLLGAGARTGQGDGTLGQGGASPVKSGAPAARTSAPVRPTEAYGRPVHPCPDVTDKEARRRGSPGDLDTLLYIRTKTSEVWICRDSRGTLFYQGHRGQPANQLPAAVSADTLFLTEVKTEDGGYVATNATGTGTTHYHVSKTKLVIENPGSSSPEDVIESGP